MGKKRLLMVRDEVKEEKGWREGDRETIREKTRLRKMIGNPCA